MATRSGGEVCEGCGSVYGAYTFDDDPVGKGSFGAVYSGRVRIPLQTALKVQPRTGNEWAGAVVELAIIRALVAGLPDAFGYIFDWRYVVGSKDTCASPLNTLIHMHEMSGNLFDIAQNLRDASEYRGITHGILLDAYDGLKGTLQDMHTIMGVFHGDINSGNVLVNMPVPDEGTDTGWSALGLFLTDFGYSGALPSHPGSNDTVKSFLEYAQALRSHPNDEVVSPVVNEGWTCLSYVSDSDIEHALNMRRLMAGSWRTFWHYAVKFKLQKRVALAPHDPHDALGSPPDTEESYSGMFAYNYGIATSLIEQRPADNTPFPPYLGEGTLVYDVDALCMAQDFMMFYLVRDRIFGRGAASFVDFEKRSIGQFGLVLAAHGP